MSDDEDTERTPIEYFSDHNTDTEQSDLDDDSTGSIEYSNSYQSYHESDDKLPLNFQKKNFVGKDGTEWSRRLPNRRIRVASVNHVTEKPRVTEIVKCAKTILETLNLLFSLEMIEHIVEYTNIFINLNIRPKFERERDPKPTNVAKIKAVFGILFTLDKYYFYHYYYYLYYILEYYLIEQ